MRQEVLQSELDPLSWWSDGWWVPYAARASGVGRPEADTLLCIGNHLIRACEPQRNNLALLSPNSSDLL